jgi:hypothetical protein
VSFWTSSMSRISGRCWDDASRVQHNLMCRRETKTVTRIQRLTVLMSTKSSTRWNFRPRVAGRRPPGNPQPRQPPKFAAEVVDGQGEMKSCSSATPRAPAARITGGNRRSRDDVSHRRSASPGARRQGRAVAREWPKGTSPPFQCH